MGFKEAVVSCFQNWKDFKGRSRRSEYWYFLLFNITLMLILSILTLITGLSLFYYVGRIYGLIALIPGFAVASRRLHDINKSEWFLLLIAIPLIGFIILLIWLAKDSDPGENKYGPNPKEINNF